MQLVRNRKNDSMRMSRPNIFFFTVIFLYKVEHDP